MVTVSLINCRYKGIKVDKAINNLLQGEKANGGCQIVHFSLVYLNCSIIHELITAITIEALWKYLKVRGNGYYSIF